MSARSARSGRVAKSSIPLMRIGRENSRITSSASVKSCRADMPPPVLMRQRASDVAPLMPCSGCRRRAPTRCRPPPTSRVRSSASSGAARGWDRPAI